MLKTDNCGTPVRFGTLFTPFSQTILILKYRRTFKIYGIFVPTVPTVPPPPPYYIFLLIPYKIFCNNNN